SDASGFPFSEASAASCHSPMAGGSNDVCFIVWIVIWLSPFVNCAYFHSTGEPDALKVEMLFNGDACLNKRNSTEIIQIHPLTSCCRTEKKPGSGKLPGRHDQ